MKELGVIVAKDIIIILITMWILLLLIFLLVAVISVWDKHQDFNTYLLHFIKRK